MFTMKPSPGDLTHPNLPSCSTSFFGLSSKDCDIYDILNYNNKKIAQLAIFMNQTHNIKT